MKRRRYSYPAVLLVLTGLYFAAGKLGLSLALLHSSASAVWPPTGLALAAVLLLGYRVWPAILVGSFLVNLSTEGTAVTSAAIAGGNTAEALLGAWIAQHFARGRRAFESPEDIVRFVFFAVVPATIVSATVGVTALAVTGFADWHMYGPIWMTWWTGNFASALTVTPLLLIWSGRLPSIPGPQRVEGLILLAAVVGTGFLIFGGVLAAPLQNHPIGYLTLLPLLWAAFRFQQHGAVTAAVITCAIATWGTLRGEGPFAVDDPNFALLLLQLFVAVSALTALVLAASVAERSRVMHAIRTQEQQMRIALESGRMGTWQWELASGRVTWSPRLEEIHGLRPGEFGGTFQDFLDDVHPEDVERVQRVIRETVERASDHEIQYRLKLRDGTIRWVEGRGRFELDTSGRPVRLVGVCMDVTERKLAEVEREQLLERERQARAEAEHASQAKDQFLAILSHELRTPLTPALLTASLLEQSADVSEPLRQDIGSIRRNIELEARLIDDLLDLTKVTRGKLDLELQPCDVHALLRRAVDICSPEGRSNVALELLAEPSHVMGDPARLQQVFWNLLSNAVKFSPPEAPIILRTRCEGEVLVVEVIDRGPGIEAELMPRLFSPFEQGLAARQGRTSGLGLGLAISKALVTAHGGTLEARTNAPAPGTTFVVRIAAARQAAPLEPAPPPALTNGRAHRPLRLLLVEDHEGTLRALRRLLTGRGHNVTTATTNAEALGAAERGSFDLVISDLGLPDGLAYDLMSTLRDRFALRGIALSGYGMDGDIARGREAGFIEHLTKPVDVETLSATIDRAVASDAPADGRPVATESA